MFKYFNAIQKNLPEILGILICLIFGMLSGYSVTPDHLSWYHQLNAPKLTPPDFIFGPVWTILYIFLGIALGQLYRHKNQNPYCYYVFLIQLALNFTWSPLFFHLHYMGLALILLLTLWSLTLVVVILARHHKLIRLMLVPYLLWVTFATYLNAGFVYLNESVNHLG